ncbi:MAG TPA: hypothetical protein VJ695_10400 [Nitrososphaera sp.]|nr:hypothetical protein [Nitrososphaera sp.]
MKYYKLCNKNKGVGYVTEQHRQLERNKKNVMGFYDMMFNQNNPAEAIKR